MHEEYTGVKFSPSFPPKISLKVTALPDFRDGYPGGLKVVIRLGGNRGGLKVVIQRGGNIDG